MNIWNPDTESSCGCGDVGPPAVLLLLRWRWYTLSLEESAAGGGDLSGDKLAETWGHASPWMPTAMAIATMATAMATPLPVGPVLGLDLH